jgi:hypothetical protein
MNYDTDKRHVEMRVMSWKYDKAGRIERDDDGYPIAKESRPTERGIVSITEKQAHELNLNADRTSLMYKLEPKRVETKEEKKVETAKK